MSTPKAVVDARAKVREIEDEIKSLRDEQARIEAAQKPARAKLEALRRRFAKRPVVIKTPDGYRVSDGIHAWAYNLWRTNAKSAKALAEHLLAANEKLALSGSGIGNSLRGAAAKTRYTSPADQREIKRLAAIRDRKRRDLDAAEKALRDKVADAFEAGDKVTPDELHAAASTLAWARVHVRDVSMFDTYKIESAERRLEVARRHLDHATSRSKDPCPCSWCVSDRTEAQRKAEWEARAKEAAKAKAAAEKAAAKEQARAAAKAARALAKAKRVAFTCPDCEAKVEAPVQKDGQDEVVECPECNRGRIWLATIVYTPLSPAPGQQQLIA